MLGLLVSAYLQSMSLFGFALAALWESLANRTGLAERWRAFWRRPDYWVFGLHFVIVLLGFWSVQDWPFWLERLRIKLPFLILPLAFFFMPQFNLRQYQGLLLALILLLALSSLGILGNYLLYYEDIQLLLKQGQAMPMPSNHIRFSLLLAIGVIAAGQLYFTGFYWKNPVERQWIAALGLFLLLFLHILSVRSGIAALYLALLVLSLRYAWVSRRYGVALGVMAALIAIPLLGYALLPSFKMKVDYALYDLRMRQSGQGHLLSDSERITTLRVGWNIFQSAPLLGVGAGNLDQAVAFQYRSHFPQAARVMMPHNQFLYVAAGSGLVGLLLFCIAIFLPLFYQKHYEDYWYLGVYVVILASLLVEATLENAMGVALVTYFLLGGLALRNG
jgi:hypothetical protein